jgi:hypothetical protein
VRVKGRWGIGLLNKWQKERWVRLNKEGTRGIVLVKNIRWVREGRVREE